MFDFQGTLDEAKEYEKQGNISLATFNYWLINFAFEDEEFPYYYTEEIGAEGANGFLRLARKHCKEILNDNNYIRFKQEVDVFPSYKKYIFNFENVIKSFIKKSKS